MAKRGQGREGRRSWWRSRWLAAAVAVLVVAGAVGGWLLTRGGGSAQATPLTVQATSGTVKQTVSASGTIEAAQTANLDFAVSGTVTKVYVAAGDKVTKGQALAKVDDQSLVATRDAEAASLSAAEEQLSDDEDAGASDVQIASDQTSVVSARSTLADARTNVKDAVLRSTINGTVAALDLTVGDVVGSGSSGSSGGSGAGSSRTGSAGVGGSATSGGSGTSGSSGSSSSSSAVTIVSTKRFIVDATVSADDAPQVKQGLQAEITVSGSSQPVYGTVQSIGLVASASSSGAAVFPVTIDVTGQQSGLYAGTSATAAITVKQRTNVLTVLSRAVQTSGGSTYVMKMVDGKPVKTTVQIGEVYGTTTEITQGLNAGDSVQIPGISIPGGGSGRSGGFGGGGGRGGVGGAGFGGGGRGGGGFGGGGFGGGGFGGGGFGGGPAGQQ